MRADGTPLLVVDESFTELERVTLHMKGEGTFDEAWLQRLIHRHPRCLPIHEIEPGFGDPVAICMELPTPHGSVDNLLMTSDGDIVLVETKLWRNPEARRAVVAQALDYASCLFEMTYEGLQTAALKGDLGGRARPDTLLALFPENDAPDGPSFIDAVNANLRKGRLVLVVAGDGIRTETERLAASLQSHAGFHFTFALVELAVFHNPGNAGYIVHPRTLARTCMIERGIVRIDDERVSVTLAPPSADDGQKSKRKTITAEQFFEAMAAIDPALPSKLQEFLDELARIGVYPEYKRSLTIKWDPPAGRPVNLGYIERNGKLWTDSTDHAYQQDLARVLGGEVEKFTNTWGLRIGGKAPRIEAIAPRFDAVRGAIERFIDRLRQRLSEEP